ncbi:Lrp/AsnC family transcriptional regulator [Haliea sp. E17]|uniref:Lrp/AsnC family transcriptional regulator n=1 Tax=Haliea sp. E17 TaxID=3401576 RepID=UPI003AACB443
MALDRAEVDILRVLQAEGRISNVELADRVGLSESPCFRRVKKLEDGGYIRGYGARLDQRRLGLQVTAFVQVMLEKGDDRQQRDFLARVEAEEYIVECHAMSGSHDYLMKILAYSMDHFSDLCMNRVLKFPGVKNIESNFSLLAVKEGGALPVR